ncbi:MAG TPA: phage terminase large subunit [Allosphingosinicella sp.]|nr:phage terminase large subunit [Allosphingosinicella sp.]
MKPEEGWSAAAREKVIRYYRETLMSRLDSKLHGVIVLVMQRLHVDDLAGHLLRERPGKWAHLNLPAIAPGDRTIELGGGRTHLWKEGEVLQLEREPHPVLDDLREEQGSLVFEAQWLQEPAPEGGLFVKKGDVIFYERQPSLAMGQIFQSWDTALSGDSSACYSVCTTWLRIGNQHFLIDVFRERLTFPDLLRAAKDLYQAQRPEAVLIENKGSGMSLIQQLRAETGMTAVGLTPDKDKLTRLVTVLPMFQARQVLMPAEKPWLPALLQELHGFPGTRYNDQVDSISQYLNWAREQSYGEFSYDFGYSPAEPDEPSDVGWEPLHIPIQRWG